MFTRVVFVSVVVCVCVCKRGICCSGLSPVTVHFFVTSSCLCCVRREGKGGEE